MNFFERIMFRILKTNTYLASAYDYDLSHQIKKKVLKETKPIKKRLTMNRAISEMGIMLRKNNINVTNFSKHKPKATYLFTEYFTKNKISNKKKKDKILKTVIENIIRG